MNSNAGIFLDPILEQLKAGHRPDSQPAWREDTFSSCAAPNMVEEIFKFSGGWLYNSFIFAPVVSSLVVPSPVMTKTEQQMLIDAAGNCVLQKQSKSIPTFANRLRMRSNSRFNPALGATMSASPASTAA